MQPLQKKPDPRPICTRYPHLFDRINEGESKKDANERMAHAAHLCKVACHRVEQCRQERSTNPDYRVTGVIAGRYRAFSLTKGKEAA